MAPYFSLAFVFLCPSFQSRDPWGSGSTASTFCSHLPLTFLQCGFSSSTHRLLNLQRALTCLPLFRLCRCFLKSHSLLEILSSIGFYVGTSSWSLSWRFPGTVSASLNEGCSWPSILDSNFIKSIAQCHSYTYDIYIYFFSSDRSFLRISTLKLISCHFPMPLAFWMVWFTAFLLDKHYKLLLNTLNRFSLKGKGREMY